MSAPVRVERRDEARTLEVTLATPPGNIIDRAMLAALEGALDRAGPPLVALTLRADGPHFSYGASIPEHLPGPVDDLLPAMHALVRRLIDLPLFTQAVVQGRCLGGGLELCLACDRIVCAKDASLGQPEIDLAVFAPVASALLGLRVGEARATTLLATGRRVGSDEALALRLVDAVADDPLDEARRLVSEHLASKSAAALGLALRAARRARARAASGDLDALERLYLGDLMATADAEEGVRAFLEKRPARYVDR